MSRIITLDAVDLVLRVDSKSEGAIETGNNRGPYVERVLAVTGNPPGDPWCAAEVADTGVKALGKLWPLPLTASCQALANFAKAKGIRFLQPQRGDVFLLWYPSLGRFAHTGFCIQPLPDGRWLTHDGNTSGAGSREGWMKAKQKRKFKPEDRFIRWVNLLP